MLLIVKSPSETEPPRRQEGTAKSNTECAYNCISEAEKAEVTHTGCKAVSKVGKTGKICFCMSGEECNKAECSEAGFDSLGPEMPLTEKPKGKSGAVKVFLEQMNVLGAICATLCLI